jgi:hypothetical protein
LIEPEARMLFQRGKAYSQDLRERVFAAAEDGGRVGQIARGLRVSVSYVSKVLSRFCQLSSLPGATFISCGAIRSSSFQDTEHDDCPAHMAKAPCGGGNVLAHARSGAEEVPEFVVTAAISSCRWDALEAEHRSTSALNATMILLEAIVKVAICPMPHATAELHPDRLGIGVVAVRRHPVGDHTGDHLC